MTTVSDGIRPGGECQHPDTYRCRETCECLCVPCWNKRHVTQERVTPGRDGGAEHRYLDLAWKADGRTARYSAMCSCGWISTNPEAGYGYAFSHMEDWAQHKGEDEEMMQP